MAVSGGAEKSEREQRAVMRAKNITIRYLSRLPLTAGKKSAVAGSKILLAVPGLTKDEMYRIVFLMLKKEGFTKHLFDDWLFSISQEDEKYLEEKTKKEMEITRDSIERD